MYGGFYVNVLELYVNVWEFYVYVQWTSIKCTGDFCRSTGILSNCMGHSKIKKLNNKIIKCTRDLCKWSGILCKCMMDFI